LSGLLGSDKSLHVPNLTADNDVLVTEQQTQTLHNKTADALALTGAATNSGSMAGGTYTSATITDDSNTVRSALLGSAYASAVALDNTVPQKGWVLKANTATDASWQPEGSPYTAMVQTGDANWTTLMSFDTADLEGYMLTGRVVGRVMTGSDAGNIVSCKLTSAFDRKTGDASLERVGNDDKLLFRTSGTATTYNVQSVIDPLNAGKVILQVIGAADEQVNWRGYAEFDVSPSITDLPPV
jgi:hypothetical protein